MKKVCLVLLCFFAVQQVHAKTKRCGWLENPTPGNRWLTDSAGDWTISTQGSDGHRLKDSDWEHIPKFLPNQFVERNIAGAGYGYGCACLVLDADKVGNVTKIYSGKSLPLSQCRNDKKLPKERNYLE
jgi:hypothetical protein